MSKRIVVAGSRNYNDYNVAKAFIRETVKMIKTNIIIVSGGCRGADMLGERYAAENGLSVERYLPEWDKYGKSAGIIRNKKMAEVCDFAICFWDGKSRGTAFMIEYCKKLNKDVIVKMI